MREISAANVGLLTDAMRADARLGTRGGESALPIADAMRADAGLGAIPIAQAGKDPMGDARGTSCF